MIESTRHAVGRVINNKSLDIKRETCDYLVNSKINAAVNEGAP